MRDELKTERCPRIAGVSFLAALLVSAASGVAAGQALAVQPVTLQMTPGQKAATLTVTNRGASETAIQIRAFGWNQESGKDELAPSDEVLVSPPLATIPAGATQLVRVVLRRSPSGGREVTYRLLLDQIPPPAVSGVVRVVLRLSIPIFAPPMTASAPRVQFHMENEAGQLWLVAVNEGLRHDRFRDVLLTAKDGAKLKPDTNASPYVLAGATRRWAVSADGSGDGKSPPLPTGVPVSLTAHGEDGTIQQQVSLDHLP